MDKHFFTKAKHAFFRRVYLYTGIDISVRAVSFLNFFAIKKQLRQFKKQGQKSSVSFPVTKLSAYYEDKQDSAGTESILGYAFYQNLYVAQQIYQNNPVRHIDIGSDIYSFVAHVASYREIEICDIRPLNRLIANVKFKQLDVMQLNDEDIESTDSISCLHALEHFGLGRYGDPICYDGYLLGFQNIYKMLKPQGIFYFSVPLGKQRVEFHAHRVFSLKYLLELIMPYYEIKSFSYIDDNDVFHENVIISEEKISNNCGCRWGCAVFELVKLIK